MPNYHYKCQDAVCSFEFEIYRSIKSDILRECPECHQNTLEVVPYAVMALIDEPKTIGVAAERNMAKLGRYERETMWEMQKRNKEKAKQAAREELLKKLPEGASIPESKPIKNAWWRPGTDGPMMELNKLDPKQKKRYVEEGKK